MCGDWLVPMTILGRFSILCAILRQLHLILHIALFTSKLDRLSPDAFFVDQLSAGLPLLKAVSPAPVFFYCHFPDLLLARGRARVWKRLYRVPFDFVEQWSMTFADAIAVNSAFTKSIVSQTWPVLAQKKDLQVVYPCIDTTVAATTTTRKEGRQGGKDKEAEEVEPLPWKKTGLVLSINRFERKKDVALALRAFARLPAARRGGARLVVAGGYDARVAENVAYHAELGRLAEALGLRSATARTVVSALHLPADVAVVFLLSVPHALKELLLCSATLLVYTPQNEHFGIVPLEAMLRGVPVLAADSGGPRETVVDGVTGWLRDPANVGEWSEVIGRVLNDMSADELERMGRAGRERVKERFAEEHMAERLERIFDGMGKGQAGRGRGLSAVLLAVAGMVAVGGLIGALVLGGGGRR